MGAVADRCGPTASGRWRWWTCRRSGGRSSWCSRRRWRCPSSECSAGTVTEQDREIAPPREKLTTRAARWATRQAGRARPVGDVAGELGCSWHRVNESVRRWGEALLAADTQRSSQRTVGLKPEVALALPVRSVFDGAHRSGLTEANIGIRAVRTGSHLLTSPFERLRTVVRGFS